MTRLLRALDRAWAARSQRRAPQVLYGVMDRRWVDDYEERRAR